MCYVVLLYIQQTTHFLKSIDSFYDYFNFWQLIATDGNFLQLMATFGNWWQLFAAVAVAVGLLFFLFLLLFSERTSGVSLVIFSVTRCSRSDGSDSLTE